MTSLKNHANRFVNEVHDASSSCWSFTRIYGDAAQNLTQAVLSVMFLSSKLTPQQISQKVGKISLVSSNILSVYSSVFYAYVIRFQWQDISFAWILKQRALSVIPMLNLISIVNDYLILAVSMVASTKGLLGEEEQQQNIYQSIRAWGLVSVVFDTVLPLIDYAVTHVAHKRFKEGISHQEAVKISHSLCALEPGDERTDQIAVLTRLCLNKDCFWKLQEKLEDVEDEQQALKKLIHIAYQNIVTELNYNLKPKICLSALFCFLLAIEKIYTPNSFQSAVINCGASVAAAYFSVREKLRERELRAAVG